MPALDLALGLRVERCTTNVIRFLIFQPFGQITRDVTRPVIAQQVRHVANDGLVAPRHRQSQFDRVSHFLGPLI